MAPLRAYKDSHYKFVSYQLECLTAELERLVKLKAPCEHCVDDLIYDIGYWLIWLLNTAPSGNLELEFRDLDRLTKLQKRLLKFPGNFASDVYEIMNRKMMSLYDAHIHMLPALTLGESSKAEFLGSFDDWGQIEGVTGSLNFLPAFF